MSPVRATVLAVVAGVVLTAASAASADPTITFLADSGQTWAKVWFDPAGTSSPQEQTRQGTSRPGLLAQVNQLVIDAAGERSEVTATSRIVQLTSPASLGVYASVEPAGLRQGCRGQSRGDMVWRLQIDTAPASLAASLWASGTGSSGLSVYDETTGDTLMNVSTAASEAQGTSLTVQLPAGHIYQVQGFAQADASQGGDPSTGLEIRTGPVAP